MNDLIEILGLTKAYDAQHVAVNNISLTLPRGKIIGLLGPNGSGKTTLIKMLNGLLTPTQGSIRIGGVPVGVETKAHVSYLPDRTYLSGNKKVTQIAGSGDAAEPGGGSGCQDGHALQGDEGEGAAHPGHEPGGGSLYPG